jgi:integrase
MNQKNYNLVETSPLCSGELSRARTRGGAEFDPTQEIWEIRELTFKTTISFNLPKLSRQFCISFKAVLLWYAKNKSLPHLSNLYQGTCRLFDFVRTHKESEIGEIIQIDLVNYRAHLGKEREWHLGAISCLLKKWYSLGYPGISKDAVDYLNQVRIKGVIKGVATSTMDPLKGPFTPIESNAIQHALNESFRLSKTTSAEYVLCWILIAFGMRPTQYAALKVCDISVMQESSGTYIYSIRIPRAKTRDSDPRGEFKERLLTPQIGKIVVQYANSVKAHFSSSIDDPEDAPLFFQEVGEYCSDSSRYHLTGDQLGSIIERVLNRLKVVSERTGQPISICSRRFRSTIGTRAAEEGHGALVIAELLDHSDTQNVGVYISATPLIIERIDRAVAMQMAPLAQAFAGKLIKGPSGATQRDNPLAQIRAPNITGDFKPISSCGAEGFCNFLKPIACYSCNSFEPWIDGPHEAVLQHLIAERERLVKTSDIRIASINDRTILAIAEVIRRCEQQKKKESQDG